MMHFLLVGNPNCGKTTLFNVLTGSHQHVGNWPGVTVEKKSGMCTVHEQQVTITDLPGIYSLAANSSILSQDEQVAIEALHTLPADCLINVVDACRLERHLYLTSQLLELGKPVIVVLNMMDVAAQRGISIDSTALAAYLGCPVVLLQAHKQIGLAELHNALSTVPQCPASLLLPLSSVVRHTLSLVAQQLSTQGYCHESLAPYHALRIVEGGVLHEHHISLDLVEPDLDILLADARYQKVHELTELVQKKNGDTNEHFTAKVDKVVLHRFWALPIFFSLMYLMFFFAINIGGVFQDFFDITTDTVFVQGMAWVLNQMHLPQWFIALVANGIGKGLNTTLTFIPVIAAMYFFLALLETSGYMARAAFIVDKVMRLLGLPGKSFVPMIVGFGCNVPAIMAARTLDSERDRLLTVMMSPFMSCSARLAIYAVFVAAFFPSGGAAIVFSLYFLGIVMAVFTGFLLRRTYLKGDVSPLILELPAYHKPSLKRLLKETSMRLRFFVYRAVKVIVPVCVLLGGLNAITIHGTLSVNEANAQSVLAVVGQWLTPVFAPMGISQENWPATVGLLTGTLAKEVVVGTLNTLYSQTSNLSDTLASFDFLGGLYTAVASIPQNIAHLGEALLNPVAASAADGELSSSAYGVMAQRFDGQIGAYAYLLFILLYVPCVSTIAAISQEANKKFMWLSVIWSFFVAYLVAVLFYQVARHFSVVQHHAVAIIVVGCGILTCLCLRQNNRRRYALANS